jgi:hypothetical protein
MLKIIPFARKMRIKYRFSEIYFSFFSLLVSGGLLTMVIAASYFGLRPMEMLSFKSADEWCDQVTSGIGNHCFSDYQTPMVAAESNNPWTLGNSFTPTAMLPHVFFNLIRNSFIGPEWSLYIYLILGTAAISFPLFHALKKLTFIARATFAIAGSVFSVGSLNGLDRGTSAIFAIPFLYLAARNYLLNNPKLVLIWSSLASFIRPQFIVIAFLLLALSAYKHFFSSILIFISSIFLGFMVWPGDRKLHFASWLNMISGYDQYAPSTTNWPINLSAGKSLSRIFLYFDTKFPSYEIFNSLNSWTLNNFKTIGILVGISVFILIAVLGKRISKSIVVVIALLAPVLIPGVSWAYYLLVLVPISALIISANDDGQGMLDIDQRLNPVAKIHILISVALVLSPFVLPTAFDPMNTSLIAQIWGPILMVLFVHLFGLGIWQGFNKSLNLKTIFAKNPANPV